jgi:formylglycine-generating enzyme required for sulfatase activity
MGRRHAPPGREHGMVAIGRTIGPASPGLPLLLLALLLALIAGQMGWLRWPAAARATLAGPATVLVPPHPYSYRAPGEYYRGTTQLDGPLVAVAQPPLLEIMTYQVTAADYGRCVAEGACETLGPARVAGANLPATGAGYEDALAYAAWLSERTGVAWRLPTVAEWVFAAGERAVDPALDTGTTGAGPAARWLALYEREAAAGDGASAAPEPLGSFGFNSLGVADIGGSVWEWTSDCATRTTVDAAGGVLSSLANCGVRYLEGRHRAAMSYFIRDPRAGGCSMGQPPDNLGFRLVRDRGPAGP